MTLHRETKMSRNQNLVVAIIITLIFLLVCPDSFSLGRPRGGRPKIVGELQRVIRQKEAEGCDVSEVRNLQRRAKQAMESGNKEEARQLLQQAMQKARALTPGATEQAGSTKTSTATRTVTLPIPEPEVIYTVAVPKKEYSDGGRITNFATAFETETLKTEDGRLSLQLDDRPVFLETPAAAAAKAVTLSEDSPFGLLDPTEYTRELADLNAKWIRFSGKDGLIWAFIEPERGRFDFAKLDKLVTHLSKNKINLLITVSCYNHWDQIGEGATLSKGQKPHLMLPKDLDAYRNFLQKAVERYDGDGIDDAPGSPVARYWQIQNEVDFFWKDTPQNYAVLLKTSYQAIKKASPEAKVVIAGIGGVASSKGYTRMPPLSSICTRLKTNPMIAILIFSTCTGPQHRKVTPYSDWLVANCKQLILASFLISFALFLLNTATKALLSGLRKCRHTPIVLLREVARLSPFKLSSSTLSDCSRCLCTRGAKA